MPPPPKPDAVRRNARVGPIQLPAGGRKGPPPKWPLAGRPTPAEREAWDYLWTLPQAVMWERQGMQRMIARYTRVLIEAEQPLATAALLAVVTAMEDRIGMSPKGLRLLMWEIAEDEVAQKRADTAGTDVRRRLKAVD